MNFFSIPERVLVVAAHPDDAEFGCGATVAKWVKAGTKAFYVIGTNGDKGDDSGKFSRNELTQIRRQEQLDAAQVIGIDEVAFLDLEDGALENGDLLRGRVVEHIRRWKPDTVLTHDPSVVFAQSCGVNHSDHRAIGFSAVDAVYPYARSVHQYPNQIAAGLQPHKVDRLLMWDTQSPNYWEDVTIYVDQKIESLAAHKCQMHDRVKLKHFVVSNLAHFGLENKIAAEVFRLVEFA